MFARFRLGVIAASAAAIAIGIPAAGSAHSTGHAKREHTISHVLLISVDGMHQSDLDWFIANHPDSTLAKVVAGGAEYTDAQTPVPSDSFPGMVGQVTGGDPRVTGVYYDAEYSHALLPPGTTSCTPGEQLGTPVTFDESIERDSSRLDAGQGLPDLPGDILQMTGDPTTLINAAALPVDPKTCKPVYPHQYLKVNTVFNVLHDAGLRTAWSDKHPAYEILDGPEGNGIDDLFTPEINSDALEPNGAPYPGGGDWTSDNAATMQYDSYKVQAVINEIDGYDHSGTTKVGVPAILGLNFQTISTAEKLPTSDGLTGGYLPGTDIPGPLLSRALDYIDTQLTLIVKELRARRLAGSTAIIISAKHGQSPIDPNLLTRIDDAPIIAAVNAAWTALHPGAAPLVAGDTDDDAIMWWLSDRSRAATRFVASYLMSHSATGNTATGGTRTLQHSGLVRVFAGRAAAHYFGVPIGDPRHPDVWGIVQHGIVYTGGTGKIAEHGGANPDDRDVLLTVYAPRVVSPDVVGERVETTQIAPTILSLLGFSPRLLDAVRIEGTRTLPGA